MRAPSSLYSTEASPVMASAAAGSAAVEASIGSTGVPTARPTCLQGVGAAGQREAGGLAEVAAEHDRPADRGDRDLGRLGDRVDEDPFEGTGPHLADEDAGHEQLLVGGGPPAEGPERVLAEGGGPGSGRGEEVVEEVVEVGHGEARRLGRLAHEAGHGAVADADPALAGATDEKPDGRRHLLGRQPAEQVGERLDLGQP